MPCNPLVTLKYIQFSSVQSLSRVQLFSTPWTAAHQASLSITNSQNLLNSCPSSWRCHPSFSTCVVPFSSCLQSFPPSRSFLMNQLFTSDGQNIGALASASVLPVNIQDCFPLGLTDLISLQSKGPSRVFSNTTVQKHQFFSDPYITSGKTIALTIQTFVGKVMSLLLNMLSRLIIDFLPRSKFLLISWQQSPSAVILESKKIVCHCFQFFSIYFAMK